MFGQVRLSDGREVNSAMKNNIEGIIIKWTHQVPLWPSLHPQVDEVLSKESEQELLDGHHPGPLTEIRFWEAKYGRKRKIKVNDWPDVGTWNPCSSR